jgi:hypothetical protein
MNKKPLAARFVGIFQRVQARVRKDKRFTERSAAAVAGKYRPGNLGGGAAPFIKFPQARPPRLYIKIAYFAEVFGRIAVSPEYAGIKRRHMGSKTALGPPEQSGAEDPFFGAEKNCFPVGFTRKPDAKHQSRGRKRPLHLRFHYNTVLVFRDWGIGIQILSRKDAKNAEGFR